MADPTAEKVEIRDDVQLSEQALETLAKILVDAAMGGGDG